MRAPARRSTRSTKSGRYAGSPRAFDEARRRQPKEAEWRSTGWADAAPFCIVAVEQIRQPSKTTVSATTESNKIATGATPRAKPALTLLQALPPAHHTGSSSAVQWNNIKNRKPPRATARGELWQLPPRPIGGALSQRKIPSAARQNLAPPVSRRSAKCLSPAHVRARARLCPLPSDATPRPSRANNPAYATGARAT